MRLNVGGVTLQCILGDIADQPHVEAIVNAANAELRPGGGVAGAIHRAAGPKLAAACAPLAPIAPGEAVITEGFNLPNRYVIHCLGPVYGRDEPSGEILAACHLRALDLAEEAEIASIAFPAISTGAFGFPVEEAAEIAARTAAAAAPLTTRLSLIRFVLFAQDAYDAYSRQLVRAAAEARAN